MTSHRSYNLHNLFSGLTIFTDIRDSYSNVRDVASAICSLGAVVA